MRILVQTHEALVPQLAREFPDVDVAFVPPEGEPAPGVEGEVLLTWTWATPNLASVLTRGVRWIHAFGTGVEGTEWASIREIGLADDQGQPINNTLTPAVPGPESIAFTDSGWPPPVDRTPSTSLVLETAAR